MRIATLLAVLLAAVTAADALSAQDGVRLVRVPDPLVLPAEPGRNLLLEVAVPGAEPRSVWLATGPDARGRVLLAPSGDGHWQVNLADRLVGALLDDGSIDGRLLVFAEVGDRQLRSAPIAWRRPGVPALRPRCVVRGPDATTVATVRAGGTAWLDPGAVDSIAIELARDQADCSVWATPGAVHWSLERVDDHAATALHLDAERRAAWLAAGRLRLAVAREDRELTRFELRAIPGGLELPPGAARFTLVQRRSAVLPGSRDYLTVGIGDITAGQTLLHIARADGGRLVDTTSLRQGEAVRFDYGGELYALVVRRLVNHLIGDDFAELELLPAARHEQDRVERLLAHVAAADITFVREGIDHTGAEAAEHLRRKLAAVDATLTLEQFIERIGSRSSTTGQEYQVRTAAGTVLAAGDWLRQEAERMDREPPRAP